MIPFLRRKKEEPIYLDCYTSSHYAYNHAKIDYAQRYIPEWFKGHKKFTDGEEALTIRFCPAVSDYYTKGIVIPLWGEVKMTIHPIGDERGYSWASSNPDFDLHTQTHPKSQWSGFGNDTLLNVKFVSPWVFKTREPLYFSWGQPLWSQPNSFNSLVGMPAAVQFKTQFVTNINYVVEPRAEPQEVSLAPLTPMVMLHPMTDRKVEIRTHLVDNDKFTRLQQRGGGMLLNDSNDIGELRKQLFSGFRTKREVFWKKADELNKCPFK